MIVWSRFTSRFSVAEITAKSARAVGLLALCAVVAACGRPLTDAERAFAAQLHGDQLDTSRIRLIDNAPIRSYTFRILKRPRVTCQERMFPPIERDIVTAAPAAVVLFNHVYFNRDYYLDDFAEDYPEKLYLAEAMLFAHEMTHIWQWQNRARTGYHPLKAVQEHQRSDDPYLFDPNTTQDFLSYGYEQQGAIVEEYVCCAALDPDAPRTRRLYQMISQAFPIRQLPQVPTYVPWPGLPKSGICR